MTLLIEQGSQAHVGSSWVGLMRVGVDGAVPIIQVRIEDGRDSRVQIVREGELVSLQSGEAMVLQSVELATAQKRALAYFSVSGGVWGVEGALAP